MPDGQEAAMGAILASPWASWGIAGLATAGVIIRPFAWPEWVWAVGGAALLVALGSLTPSEALSGVAKGTDVYLFLTGMMLLSELARQEGLFDWLAARAAGLARGSAARLFTLVFAVGTIVTVFLSNDATAVVMTPAVAAAARAAKADQPLPYLLVCAFVANAASFVLPISNPANLVIYGTHMPPLLQWLPRYALPSLLGILATYAALRWTQRVPLRQRISAEIELPSLSAGGKLAACGIAATAMALLVSSGAGLQLGWPTFLAGLGTALLVLTRSRFGLADIVRDIAWGVLPLVAGLFVLVESLEKTGVTRALSAHLEQAARHAPALTAWASGAAVALGCNLVNNLPAGLVAGRVAELAQLPDHVRQAVLIGVDLGPNLSVTGSLATILWLTALRREGQAVSAWSFLKIGILVMPPALAAALAGAVAFG
jgi:arsenical pump membrane protein